MFGRLLLIVGRNLQLLETAAPVDSGRLEGIGFAADQNSGVVRISIDVLDGHALQAQRQLHDIVLGPVVFLAIQDGVALPFPDEDDLITGMLQAPAAAARRNLLDKYRERI